MCIKFCKDSVKALFMTLTLEDAATVTTQPTDSELISQYRAGDPTAFDKLHDRYHQQIRDFLSKMVWSRSEIDDVAQAVWIHCHRHLDSITDTSVFQTWLHRVAINAFKGWCDRTRRHRSRMVTLTDLAAEGADDPLEQLIYSPVSFDPDALTGFLEERMQGLSEACQRVVRAFHLEGKSMQQIADEEGISLKSAYAWRTQARRRMSL
jgi:RNA polymerase sigma-70 factor (ECF subfamily)